MTTHPASSPMTLDAPTFLARLSEDGAFRQELAARPTETLAHLGFDVAPEAIPASVELPSPEVIARTLENLGEPSTAMIPWADFAC